MKIFITLALLLTSTVSMANSLDAAIANDAVVKAVISSIEGKYEVKCQPLSVTVDKNGVIKAQTNCYDIVPSEDSSEGSVSIDIDGEVDGEGKNASIVITNIGLIIAG